MEQTHIFSQQYQIFRVWQVRSSFGWHGGLSKSLLVGAQISGWCFGGFVRMRRCSWAAIFPHKKLWCKYILWYFRTTSAHISRSSIGLSPSSWNIKLCRHCCRLCLRGQNVFGFYFFQIPSSSLDCLPWWVHIRVRTQLLQPWQEFIHDLLI